MDDTPAMALDLQAAVKQRIAEIQATAPPAEQITPRTFRFLNLAEMLIEPAPPDWLIRGFLERDTLSCLFGAPGSMKSFLALDMSLCIASGRPWHGATTKSGPVFYIAGEGFRGVVKRIQAWVVAHGVDINGVPLFTADTPVQFLDQTEAEAVTAAVAELAGKHGPPRLVVVDTLARCFGGDENSTQDMSAFVAALDQLRGTFGCAAMVIHHVGLADSNRGRGSSVLKGALDFEYSLKVVGDTRTLSCTKAKDHEAPSDMNFEPEQVDTGWTDRETGQAIMSCILRTVDGVEGELKPLTPAQNIALEALKAVCTETGKAHIATWRKEAQSRGISQSEAKRAKDQAFTRAASALLRSGHVETADEIYWLKMEQTEHLQNKSSMFSGEKENRTEHTSIGRVLCSLPCSVPEYPNEDEGKGRWKS